MEKRQNNLIKEDDILKKKKKKENIYGTGASQVAIVVKNPPATAGDLRDEM